MKKEKYSLYELIPIRFGDPISGIKLTDKYVFIGTMMGRTKYISLTQNSENLLNNNHNISQITDVSTENISGITYNNEYNMLFFSIGDEQILAYDIQANINNNNNNSTSPIKTIDIYENEFEHNLHCSDSFIFMSNDSLLRIELPLSHCNKEKLECDIENEYEILFFDDNSHNVQLKKMKYNSAKVKGKITMTNYSIPLDFDGSRFCWVEYVGEDLKNLCIINLPIEGEEGEKPLKKLFNKSYDRINFAKFLRDDKILIVHKLNLCEIRKIDEDFTLLESFKNIGDEILAVDVFYHKIIEGTEPNEVKISDSKNDNFDKLFRNKKNIEVIKVNPQIHGKLKLEPIKQKMDNLNGDLRTDTLKLVKNKVWTKEENEEQTVCSITTLDIDGNVNIYENEVEKKLFNLFDIKNIGSDHKEKQFFAMGYVYYIKSNLNYFCISGDHGCFIIKDNDM